MAPPPCPQPQSVSVITGFITPATDTAAPNSFAGGITVSVIDTVENEVVRILESADAFAVQVEWCICGPLIQAIDGCWNISAYIDDIDGGTPRTTGQLGTTQQVAVTWSVIQNPHILGRLGGGRTSEEIPRLTARGN